MFTTEQIRTAHANVKSGADFPTYIKEIKTLGVLTYTTYVNDGHTDYEGMNNYSISTSGKYSLLEINPDANILQFRKYLAEHQRGQTNYIQFCEQAASTGVDRWVVDLKEMSCTYLDQRGDKMLVEEIPG